MSWGGQPKMRVQFLAEAGTFLFFTVSRPALRPTQPPIQWVTGGLPSGVKRPGHEADHLPPPNAEVKNRWSYTSIPHMSAWHGARYNFIFLQSLTYKYT
jgi:hypothetical protein